MQTESGIVGVLATPATFRAGCIPPWWNALPRTCNCLTNTLPGLVEPWNAATDTARRILEAAIKPCWPKARYAGAGCTPSFVLPLIRESLGRK
jgi:hypothetical protein